MGEMIDKAKGKVKQVGGVIAGDPKLEAEGKRDRMRGAIKGGFEEVKQRIKDAARPPPPKRSESHHAGHRGR